VFNSHFVLGLLTLIAGRDAPATAHEVAVIQPRIGRVRAVAFSTDLKRVACASATAISFLDIDTSRQLANFPDRGVTCLAFSPDGTTVAAGNTDHVIRLWDVAERRVRTSLKHHAAGVRCVSYSPDGRHIASGSDDGTVMLWDVNTAQSERLGQSGQEVSGVAFSPDSKTLAWPDMTKSALSLFLGTKIHLIDVATRRSKGSVRDGFGADRLAFSQDGKTLATSSVESNVKLWDVAERKLRLQLPAGLRDRDERTVTGLACGPDGLVVTADCRGGVRLWNADKGTELASWRSGEAAYWLSFASNGKVLATSSPGQGIVRLWDAASLLKMAKTRP
jgi:WD40 repeat protein